MAPTRVDAELISEQAPSGSEKLERLGLPPTAVEGQGEPFAGAFAQGVLGAEELEIGQCLLVPAEREGGVERVLGAVEPQLVEARSLGRSEGFGGDVDEGRASPEAESSTGQSQSELGVAVGQGLASVCAQANEPPSIDGGRSHPQPVAGRECVDGLGAERCPELRHIHLHELSG